MASPYITETDLLARLAQRDSRILTSTTPEDLARTSSSLSALGEILRLNIPCCYYDDGFLHAKVYIFGEKYAIVSSANFTKSALGENLEIGVQLDGAEVAELIRWFDGLWNPDQLLTIEELERIRPQVEAEELAKAAVPESQIEGWRFEKPAGNEQPESHDFVESEYPDSPELIIHPTSKLISLLRMDRPGWVCNTKREPPNYPLPIKLEELMRRRSLAATWQDNVAHKQMRLVQEDDLVLMHGNKGGADLPGLKNGIVGVGLAKGSSFQALDGYDPERLSMAELGDFGPSELEKHPEWRIGIKEWLFWDPKNPIEIDGTQNSFHELKDDRRKTVIQRLRARLAEQK
ncbi:phospholipase D-like domain-containing protein [Blastopirellula sediminis]|uniref:phospholipase D-like domain-containing protein n=1 Tax=Blastopirellula sediminis TaxID=2894196 RepID=UPI0036F44258